MPLFLQAVSIRGRPLNSLVKKVAPLLKELQPFVFKYFFKTAVTTA